MQCNARAKHRTEVQYGSSKDAVHLPTHEHMIHGMFQALLNDHTPCTSIASSSGGALQRNTGAKPVLPIRHPVTYEHELHDFGVWTVPRGSGHRRPA